MAALAQHTADADAVVGRTVRRLGHEEHRQRRLAHEAPESVRQREALGRTHLLPGVALDVGQHLLEVVAIVMHPLAHDLADREVADLRMIPPARHIVRLERRYEYNARRSLVTELAEQSVGVGRTVVASAGNRD